MTEQSKTSWKPPKVGDHTSGLYEPGNPYLVGELGQISTVIIGDGPMEYEVKAVVEDLSPALQCWFGTVVEVNHRERPSHRRGSVASNQETESA